MVGVLHQDCHQAPQTRTLFGSPRSTALVNLMTNVTEQLEGYQSESDIGPALHAARQVAYWSSVFVSMMSDNASSILDTSNGYSACTTATLTSTITSTHCTTSSTSTTALTPICQPTIAPFAASASNPSLVVPTTAISKDQASQSNHQPLSVSTQPNAVVNISSIPSISSITFTPYQQIAMSTPPPVFVSSYQATSFDPIVTFSSHPTNSSTSCTAGIPNHQATSSVPRPVITTSNRPAPVRCTSNQETTTDTPPAIYSSGYFTNQHTSVSVPPTFSSAASASAPATTSVPSVVSSQAVTQPNCVTDTVTLEVFRNYGSGSLSRWLDSLRIPRNNDSLQQVKELWELGSANCPPLQKCTVTMQNHRSETSGKNTSLFSQRKFMYNLFRKHNFDENDIFAKYNEVRLGKLYKILNSKEKKT